MRAVNNFVLGVLITLFATSSICFAQGYRQLATKEAQLQALDEVIMAIKYQYGGYEIKEELFGTSIEVLRAKYADLIEKAMTVDEALGFVEKVPRQILTRHQFRHNINALISELHDGHINITSPYGKATILGIRTVSLGGRLYVSSFSDEKVKVVRQDMPIQRDDEIIEVDGRPVSFYKNRNLNYGNSGTIEVRKDEAFERILEIPHQLIPPLSQNKTATVKFRRGTVEFTNEYAWTTIDAIDLTRPLTVPEGVLRSDPYQEDAPLQLGAMGTVRSYFFEGLMRLAKARDKDGKPIIKLTDLGEQINFFRTGQLKVAAAQFSIGAVDSRVQKTLSNSDANNFALSILSMAPVNRIRAHIVEVGSKKIGVIRIPSYSPESAAELFNEIGWIASAIAVFNKTEGLDTVILDQLSNPGGAVTFGHMVLAMFASKDKPLKAMRTRLLLSDRLMGHAYLHQESDFSEVTPEQRREFIENLSAQAEAGKRTSDPVPFSMDTDFKISDQHGSISPLEDMPTWDKKLVVLADSRSASCAEIVPSILKDNGRALLVGEKTMGIFNTLCGHVNSFNLSEMNFRCPYAINERANGECAENIGIIPDVERHIGIEDSRERFVGYASDVLATSLLYQSGKSPDEIQAQLNKKDVQKLLKTLSAEDIKKLASIEFLTKQLRDDLAQVRGDLEQSAAQWANVYIKFFDELERLENAGLVPAASWKYLSVPLPKELIESDPILKTSTRKDVILRRFEEMMAANKFAGKPNTEKLVKAIFKASYKIQGYFNFGLSCSDLLSSIQ